MKRLISFLIFMCVTTLAFAQDTNEHLTFKGIPIDGTVNSFVNKLKQKGFRYDSTLDTGTIVMEGDFAGYSDCLLYINKQKNKDCVKMVGITFQPEDKWASLYGIYSNFKSMLYEKYGTPESSVEEFQGIYGTTPTDDMKMYYLKQDRCNYETMYSMSAGYILLKIGHISVDYRDICQVMLTYADRQNTLSSRANAIDDL